MTHEAGLAATKVLGQVTRRFWPDLTNRTILAA